MRPALACVFAFVITGTCAASVAQVPDAQTIERELAEIYATTRANPSTNLRGEVSDRVEAIMRKQSRHLVAKLRPHDGDPSAALLTDGRSTEAGIRPNGHAAFGLAVLARTTGDTDARDHALKILRFLLPTHGAGGARCADGKPWKNQWQSALWAASAGQAAWLLWDDLDARERWLAARMICDEADRFVAATPPSRIDRDTKAEENAWNSQVLALAFNMFPQHPSRARYWDAAVRWQLSSFATSSDVTSPRVIEGKPLREWLAAAGVGANLHDDYTLENHDRVHPDYMSSTRTLLTQKLFYDWAGNAPPASLRFNAADVYVNLKRLTLPDGGFVYPNAQDWHLHRNADWFDVHAAMAILFDDPQAARLMRICLETAEKMLARGDGQGGDRGGGAGPGAAGIYAEGETNFASSQAMLLELFADAYLLLRAHGEGPPPVDEPQLWQELAAVRRFDAGKFIVARTPRSVATFSYGRQVMGLVLPLRKDLLLAPNDRGLIGAVADVKNERPVLKQWELIDAARQFIAVCGELDRGSAGGGGGGALAQRFAFVALADGRVVYADVVTAAARRTAAAAGNADKPPAFFGGTIGVLNDRNWVFHDGSRTLRFAQGEAKFAAAKDADFRDAQFSSPWYNLDDALGIVCLKTTGTQLFRERPTAARGRREQLFHLNANSPLPAASVLVFYPSHTAAQTRDIARRCKLVEGRDRLRFSVVLDDGKQLDFDLARFNVETP